jgi:drug/metabolite transporter (DMT)-like permease
VTVEARPADRSSTLLAWVALTAVYLLWGSTFLAIRVGVRQVPPATFAGARYLLAGAVLYPVAVRTGGPALRASDRPAARQWLACAVVGVLLLSIGNGGVSLAEQHLDSGLVAVLVASIPFWMIAFSAVWVRRRPAANELAGVLCGLAGVAVLALGGGAAGHVGSVIVVLVAAVGWAFGSVLARRVPLPRRILLGSAMQMMAGGTVLLVVGAARGEFAHLRLGVGATAWLAFAWLVVPGSILAFSAYGYALSRLPISTVSTYAYVNPVIAVLLGVLLLGERLSVRESIGSLVIVGSIALTLHRPHETRRRPPPPGSRCEPHHETPVSCSAGQPPADGVGFEPRMGATP